ncbi:MAG TPA: ADP/ATP-dependent (S)-NAD(P)H-hydrate dehydratase, partial [Planctomycetia bacterium]|nr:ADP/ATP-dependent (S)-NAD(P)H-hydrate dehydratase [Planctomycetia bacterium]
MTPRALPADLPKLPSRARDSHKGTFGRALLVAGSPGMAGAAGLCGLAALRAGAGLATVACPAGIAAIVASYHPAYMTLPLPEDEAGGLTMESAAAILARPCEAMAIGPGLGAGEGARATVATVVRDAPVPLVIDADGLNLLSGRLSLLRHRQAGTVMTPHPGEFARLTGATTAVIQADRR